MKCSRTPHSTHTAHTHTRPFSVARRHMLYAYLLARTLRSMNAAPTTVGRAVWLAVLLDCVCAPSSVAFAISMWQFNTLDGLSVCVCAQDCVNRVPHPSRSSRASARSPAPRPFRSPPPKYMNPTRQPRPTLSAICRSAIITILRNTRKQRQHKLDAGPPNHLASPYAARITYCRVHNV